MKGATSASAKPSGSVVFPGILHAIPESGVILRLQERDDHVAFTCLFNQMYKPLCCFSLRLVFLKEVAEEVVSDVFCSLWRNRRHVPIMNVKAYLYRAVYNGSIDYLRSAKKKFCSLDAAAHLPAERFTLHEMLEHSEYEARVSGRVKRLPRACKMIYRMSREEGMKYSEIASALNISVKTVETQVSKALRELRKVCDN